MLPIQVQTEKPINTSTNASDPTPTTTEAPANPSVPSKQPTTTATIPPPPTTHQATAQSGPTLSYTPRDTQPTQATPISSAGISAAAAPGARPPAPTGTASLACQTRPPPTRTINETSNTTDEGPPPPQPGATPVPFSGSTSSHSAGSLPPPPRPGNAPSAYTPPSATSTYTPPGYSSQPPQQSGGPDRDRQTSLSHPPGYQQNTRLNDSYAPPGPSSTTLLGTSTAGTSSVGGAGLPLGGGTGSEGGLAGGEGNLQGQAGEAWKAVKGWAGTAATKVGEVEGNVWRWVDGKGGP